MENNMTLRELCDAVGVSRRTVQGYEKAGLASASGKNKYGHLLYDTNMQERIKKIRIYQQLGFTIKEIANIIDASNHIIIISLEKQIKLLKQQVEDKQVLIEKAYEMIKELS